MVEVIWDESSRKRAHISFLVLADQTQLTSYLMGGGSQHHLQGAHQDTACLETVPKDTVLLGERLFSQVNTAALGCAFVVSDV